MALTTALRLTGRDVLPLLHRVTTQALADLAPGEARATLWCDFRGRLQHRAVVAHARDGGVWLLRWDAPGDELAAVEDRSAGLSVTLAQGRNGERGLIAGTDAVPREVSTGDGTRLVVGGAPGPLAERERIALVCPRHRHEVRDEFNPFEVGLAHEVHLDKGCYTGQEALQRLVTYESVRRRPVVVRLASAPGTVPQDVLAGGERAGVLTSAAEGLGIAIVRREAIELGAALTLADGAPLVVAAAPEPARPLGRP